MTKRGAPGSGWRSIPVAVLAAALLILAGGLAVILQYEDSYNRERVEQTQGLAEILAESATAAVDFDDPIAAEEAVEAFRVNDQVGWVAIYDRENQAIAGYDRTAVPPPSTIESIPPPSDNRIRVAAPIQTAGQRIGTVYLEVDREAGSRRFVRNAMLFVLIFVATLIVTGLGFIQAQLRATNAELKDRAEALAEANLLLEEQIEERAKAEDQLRQSQKMQALGQLTGGIAHDFNNLLTVIQGSADMLARPDLPEPKRLRFARAIVQAAGSAASLTSQLLSFARRQPLKPEQLNVNALVTEMQDLIDGAMGGRIRTLLDLEASDCAVEVDKAQLQSAILNVASNARDAMGSEGVLTIRTRDYEGSDGQQMIALDISDTGQGMDQETIDRAFEPFFTTKATGKGTGLGLSQVYGFVTQSGGDVRISSDVGDGTTVTLMLPCRFTTADLATVAADNKDSAATAAAILVVEDNEEVGAFAEALLSELGHEVTRTTSAEEALEQCRSREFDLVFSDVVMPGMGGLKLAEILAKEQPRVPVILATGYSREIADTGSGGRPVILKPYRLSTLSEAITAALQRERSA